MALLALWNPNIQFLKTDGTINAGGKLVVTDHNDAESIPANYSDADGTTLNASPIVLDALGRATCYIDDGSTYDLYVKDANGATLWTVPEMTPGTETIVVRTGFSVSSNDSSVAVVISVDPNGVTNYDLSIQKEIDRATEAEKASRTEIVAGDNITVEKTVGADGQNVYTVSGDSEYNLVDDVRVNGASVVTDKVANIDVPVAGTASPLMDGKASVGNSLKYAREDHVHPTDTSREDIANKTTVVLGTSDSKYPTDKAVAKFVNSSIATNTANYISNNGEPFTSVAQLEAYSGPVTNNDYAFVTGTDSEGNTYYDRYKATVSGETVTWALEYRLNNSSFTAAQWSAINSGITSALVAKIHTHSNKDVLDGITSSDVANWNGKMDRQTVGNVSEPVYLENGIAKVATNVATKTETEEAISNSVDQTYSHTSTKAQSGVAVNEAFKTRETSKSDDSYTYIGMDRDFGGTKELYWKLVSFNTANDFWALQFEIDVSNGRKSKGSYDTEIYETKRLTISGLTPESVTNAKVLRYAAQGLDSSRGYDNNIYYEIGSSNLVTVYIKAVNYPNKTQLCRLKDVINIRNIYKITWYEPVNDAGTQPTNPVQFEEVFPAIAYPSSNIGSDSVPVYVNSGKPVSCNSSNLKAGKDDDGNVIKNTYQKKLTFDTTPTAGSTNPVTSEGIKKALEVLQSNIDTADAKGIVINEIDGENVICFE